jgi:hypothetical protein
VHALAERDIGFTGHETGMRRGEVVGLRWQICRLRRPASIRCPADHRDSRTARRRNTQKLGRGARVVHSTITRSTDCGLTKKSRHSNALPGAQPGMTPGWSSRMRTADGCDPSTSHGISKNCQAPTGTPLSTMNRSHTETLPSEFLSREASDGPERRGDVASPQVDGVRQRDSNPEPAD